MTNVFDNQNVDAEVQAIKEKYKDNPDEMIKALVHSQKHIKTLETENSDYKTKVAQSMTLEQVLEQIKSTNSTPPTQNTPTASPSSVLDENTLNQKVEEVINKKTEAQRQEEAKAHVQKVLLDKFGSQEKAVAEIKAKAVELGMSEAELNATAIRSPNAFFRLIGISEPQKTNVNLAPTGSNKNTAAMNYNPKPQNKMKEYSSILREKDGYNKYMSPQVQMQIMKEAMENPEAFGVKIQ